MVRGALNISLEDLAKAPLRCAWKGCTASCDPLPADKPPGWVCLATFRETRDPVRLDFLADTTLRDAVLCPKHAEDLEQCLTPTS